MPKLNDLAGRKFGRLLVTNEREFRNRIYWKCRCDCGTVKWVSSTALVTSSTRSCGCLKLDLEASGGPTKRHGMSGTKLHYIWSGMLDRCRNPKNKAFKYYGGRGITVCDRWLVFENFMGDMGERPTPKHSIDRIDNDGPYAPDNCRWATQKEQIHNRSPRKQGLKHRESILSLLGDGDRG